MINQIFKLLTKLKEIKLRKKYGKNLKKPELLRFNLVYSSTQKNQHYF